ncbi:MAG: ABC transporter permease subunit [Thermoclostridium sp.]|nr:ABC transporter permease subunit [Thermoclostridium sp.]
MKTKAENSTKESTPFVLKLNPILEKDMKTKLRGWRSTILISCYVILLICILFVYFAGNNVFSPYSNGGFDPRMAIDAYNLIITFQFALLFLAVPAITATSVSSERERQTLDLMLVTNTPARKIIMGKIMVSLAHTMLLLIASMPVIGVVFFFGGIGFLDIFKLLLFYVLTSFFVASCGVFFSTVFKRNIVAIITTYISLGLITFGPFIAFAISVTLRQRFSMSGFNLIYQDYVAALFSSSVFGFTSFYIGDSGMSMYYGYSGGMGILSSVAQEIESLIAVAPGFWKWMRPWLVNGLFNILASVGLLFLSASILNPIHRKK